LAAFLVPVNEQVDKKNGAQYGSNEDEKHYNEHNFNDSAG